jgi:hypothetical protein
MAGSTFKTNPVNLQDLLTKCHDGKIQLPDFQRSWVWDEDRIKGLIASVSKAFPIGALMTLENGGDVNFKPRPVEGASNEARLQTHESLLLDGQQRMTSLYQVTLRGKVVDTITPKNKKVKRWFYIDIGKALDSSCDREEAIVSVPEDKTVRENFGRQSVLDLSSPDKEFANMMYPVSKVFDWDEWQDGFNDYWKSKGDEGKITLFRNFKSDVLKNFDNYDVPVIALDKSTSKEAVCTVFEKVNTGGKALDAFELVTAMYAAEGYELRKDWFGTESSPGLHGKFKEALRHPGEEKGIISEVSNTDFLQALSLFYTREKRSEAEKSGKSGKELPPITANRNALLGLPLAAYLKYKDKVEDGFFRAAKFLFSLHIYRTLDLPYQSQIIPLAAILADIGDSWENVSTRDKLTRWYWNGVFGELYGSSIDVRFARDFVEVPKWITGGPEPTTVSETLFRPDRLKTMTMRLSAAYKGVNALLMKEGARDFRSGQKFDHTIFFGENVDIHHIFPQKWCKDKGISKSVYDSIINKTPISYKTNRMIGGVAPSEYLSKLQKGTVASDGIAKSNLDSCIESHMISPDLLYSDQFEEFMSDRQKRLLVLIESAMGKKSYSGSDIDEEDLTYRGENL